MDVPFFRGAKRAITLSIPGFEGEEVKVKGVFNAWNSDATFLEWNGNAWEAPLVLAPGEYAYKLVVNGEEVLDPSNEVTVPNGFGSFNNVLTVEGGGGEAPVAIDFQFVSEGSLRFSAIPEDQEVLAFFNNRVIDVVRDEDGLSIAIPADAEEWERAWIRLYTARNGQQGGDWLIPLKFGEVVLDTKNWTVKIGTLPSCISRWWTDSSTATLQTISPFKIRLCTLVPTTKAEILRDCAKNWPMDILMRSIPTRFGSAQSHKTQKMLGAFGTKVDP